MKLNAFTAAALAVLLAGCGGSSDESEPAPEDSSAKATSEASMAMGLTEAMQTVQTPTSSPAAAAGTTAKDFSEVTCETGEVSVTLGRTADSGSPFAPDEPFDTKTVTAADCAYQAAYAGPVSEVSAGVVVSGVYQTGYAELEGGGAAFVQAGESIGTPLAAEVRSESTLMGPSRTVSLESSVEQGLYFRLDTTTADTRVDTRTVVSAVGSYSVSVPGGSTSEGTMTLNVGSESDPFVATVTSAGLVLDGYYGAEIDLQADLAECPNGGLTVATIEPLILSDNDDEPYQSGTLELTNDAGEVTTVSFSDGTATVTADDGSTATLDYGALLAVASPCTEVLTTVIQSLAE